MCKTGIPVLLALYEPECNDGLGVPQSPFVHRIPAEGKESRWVLKTEEVAIPALFVFVRNRYVQEAGTGQKEEHSL